MDKTHLENKVFKAPKKEVKATKEYTSAYEAAKALNCTSESAIKKAEAGVVKISGVKPLKKDKIDHNN